MIQDQQKLPLELLTLYPEVNMEMPLKSNSWFDVESSENTRESLVSTALRLYDETWPSENPQERKNSTDDPKVSCAPRDYKLTEEKRDLAGMRLLENEEREEEERYGISTELTLFTDPWTIKKELTVSDIGHLSRLLLKAGTVHSHILRYLPEYCQKLLHEGYGLKVTVYDHDTDSMHQLRLKKRTKRLYYILSGGWFMDFVSRRELKKDDEIGMFWDRYNSKLHFRVLSRAPIGVSSGSVTIPTPLPADPSHVPIGASSGSVAIASYTPLLTDP